MLKKNGSIIKDTHTHTHCTARDVQLVAASDDGGVQYFHQAVSGGLSDECDTGGTPGKVSTAQRPSGASSDKTLRDQAAICWRPVRLCSGASRRTGPRKEVEETEDGER